MENRTAIRYRLGAPAIFSWESAQHKRLQGEGVTRDSSVFGGFVLAPTCPPVEITIQIEVLLHPLAGAKATTRIEGEARVLRIEPRHEKEVAGGFAILTDGFNMDSPVTDKTKSEFNAVNKLLELWRSDE